MRPGSVAIAIARSKSRPRAGSTVEAARRQGSTHLRDDFTRANRAIWERQETHPGPTAPGPEHEFERIQQPVLLIDGPYDLAEAHRSNRMLLERLPQAEYVSIPGTAHFPSYEQPEEYNRIVLEFLDRTWGAAAV